MKAGKSGGTADAAEARGRRSSCACGGGAEHNLKTVDVDIPRDALGVFTGVSGSGTSSLAFGTLYAKAQRRSLESVARYARRLFRQMGIPDVDEIDGIPPAVALQQRGTPTTRSSVESGTATCANGGVSPHRARASFAQPAARTPERAVSAPEAGPVILVGRGWKRE